MSAGHGGEAPSWRQVLLSPKRQVKVKQTRKWRTGFSVRAKAEHRAAGERKPGRFRVAQQLVEAGTQETTTTRQRGEKEQCPEGQEEPCAYML